MKEELKTQITKKIGLRDGLTLISKLENLGVGDDVQLYEKGISIPIAAVKDIENFQLELSKLSQARRAFTISVVDDRIQIDTITMKKAMQATSLPLSLFPPTLPTSLDKKSTLTNTNQQPFPSVGKTDENTHLADENLNLSWKEL